MTKRPVIIDCDTGVDDACALLIALQSEELDVKAVTTVAGNVELEKTTANTLRVLSLAGREDIPVCAGSARPLFRPLHTAAYIHGPDGLHGIVLPEGGNHTTGEAAWDAIYRLAGECKGELEIIAIGPLTNLAIAFAKYGDLPGMLRRIVVMGGSAGAGNVTPAAEFNFYADPEAADAVLTCGAPVYVCGLDVTHRAYMTPEEIGAIAALGARPCEFFAQVIQAELAWANKRGVPGAPLHDPCAAVFAMDDSLFVFKHQWLRVETKGTVTDGKLVTDVYSDKKYDPNAYLVLDVQREAFIARVTALMKRYAR